MNNAIIIPFTLEDRVFRSADFIYPGFKSRRARHAWLKACVMTEQSDERIRLDGVDGKVRYVPNFKWTFTGGGGGGSSPKTDLEKAS